jgi:predicted XRE-type DNA-binding protein
MSATKNSTIYDSLPPQISGKKLGQIHVRFPKIMRKDGKPNVGFRVKFDWWGQKSEPTVLTVPWKPGQLVNDAIFPVRVDRGSLEGYFSDMESMHFSIYDSENNLFGVASLPLIWLTNNNLGFDGVISVKGVSQPKNNVVAELHVQIITSYDVMKQKLAKEILEGKQTTNVDVFQRMEV